VRTSICSAGGHKSKKSEENPMQRIPFPASKSDEAMKGQPRELNIQRMLAHLSKPVMDGFGALAVAVLSGAKLNAALRELAILRVGHLSNCAYEVYHHEAFGRHVGLTEAQLEAVKHSPSAPIWTPVERAVLEFTDDVVKNVRPSDSTLNALRKHLSDTEVMELIVSFGAYMTVCRILETTGIEIDSVSIDPEAVEKRA
jgi:4-carboxymuconolactone decarboxylase